VTWKSARPFSSSARAASCRAGASTVSGFVRRPAATSLRVGDPAYMPDKNFRVGQFFGRFSVDTMDSVSFPRQGSLASLEWRGSRVAPLSAERQLRSGAPVGRAREDLGPPHDPDVAALRRDDRRDRAGRRSVPHGGFFDLSGSNRDELSGQYALRLGAALLPPHRRSRVVSAFAGSHDRSGQRVASAVTTSRFAAASWAGRSGPASARPSAPCMSATGARRKADSTRSTSRSAGCSDDRSR